MKVTFKYGIGAFTGKIDNAVFWAQKSKLASLMRKFTYPKITTHNNRIGAIAKNLGFLWRELTVDYHEDFKTYADRYYVQYGTEGDFDPARSPYAFWTKAIWAWAKERPEVDLSTLTMEDLEVTGIAISTVKNCIQNSFLRVIDQYDDLTAGF
ncbi:MAG: hypothetical protein BWY18_00527 [Candidatus Cloacimonetes bacterium ADurb.Bin211]|nr:MAG: hypothetical protein BWY18_00527 [Candidatus Cloacimonetes bacterium ADurb.Bin211]